jgi:membrane associated rhomboid family serine protease
VIPLRDRNPTSRRAILTIVLILVNVGVFVFWQGGGTVGAQEDTDFTFEHAAIPCELTTGHPVVVQRGNPVCVDAGNPRREAFPDKSVYLAVIVSLFLHGGWLHLLGNMLFLWIFGNNIEDKLGPLGYIGFYLAGGIIATAAQVLLDSSSVIPLIGASGAIAAVMGAYLVWFPRAPILTIALFFLVEVPAAIWLAIWFVLQFFTGPDSGVAYMAHIGGFVFGAVVALLLRNTEWWRRRSGPQYRYV